MVNRYNFAAVGDDRIEQSSHLERLTTPQAPPVPRKKAPPISIPPPYARVDRNVYILLIIVVALAGVSYWALKHRRESRAANDERLNVETRAAPPRLRAERRRADRRPPARLRQPLPQPGRPEKLMLSLEVTESSIVVLEGGRGDRHQRRASARVPPHAGGEGSLPLPHDRQRRRHHVDAERQTGASSGPRRAGPARRRPRSRLAAEDAAAMSTPTRRAFRRRHHRTDRIRRVSPRGRRDACARVSAAAAGRSDRCPGLPDAVRGCGDRCSGAGIAGRRSFPQPSRIRVESENSAGTPVAVDRRQPGSLHPRGADPQPCRAGRAGRRAGSCGRCGRAGSHRHQPAAHPPFP